MIGVRSRYLIQGESGVIKKNISVTIVHDGVTDNYNFAKEINDGEYLDISPIIRDFFTHKLRQLNVLDVTVVYQDYLISDSEVSEVVLNFKVVDGYLYYNQGVNADLYADKHVLISSEELKIAGQKFYFYFDAKKANENLKVKSYPNGNIDRNINLPVGVHLVELDNYDSEDFIVLNYNDGQELIIYIEKEIKYQTHVVDFLNKYGVWQRLFFNKKNTQSIDVDSSEYRNAFGREFVKYNVNGRDKLVLNTSWIPQQMNSAIQELLLSEEVYVDNELYNIDQKSITYKTRVNDTLINYEVQFINANNLII